MVSDQQRLTAMTAKGRSKSNADRLAEETTTFLRDMHHFNKGIARRLSPILEREHGIDLRLYFIIKYIENGIIHPSAISQASHLPNSVITRHIDQLVERKYLTRSLDPEDSRRIRLILTDEGARIAHAADASLTRIAGSPLERISEERREVFLSVLSELAGAVED